MKENVWSTPMTEMLKWGFFSVLLALGISLNYLYVDQLSTYVRLAVMAMLLGTAGFAAYKTILGQQLWSFMHSARTELRKVVWPTRPETVQVTIIVVIMVIIMSLILWGFDMALFKLMAWFTGRGV